MDAELALNILELSGPQTHVFGYMCSYYKATGIFDPRKCLYLKWLKIPCCIHAMSWSCSTINPRKISDFGISRLTTSSQELEATSSITNCHQWSKKKQQPLNSKKKDGGKKAQSCRTDYLLDFRCFSVPGLPNVFGLAGLSSTWSDSLGHQPKKAQWRSDRLWKTCGHVELRSWGKNGTLETGGTTKRWHLVMEKIWNVLL